MSPIITLFNRLWWKKEQSCEAFTSVSKDAMSLLPQWQESWPPANNVGCTAICAQDEERRLPRRQQSSPIRYLWSMGRWLCSCCFGVCPSFYCLVYLDSSTVPRSNKSLPMKSIVEYPSYGFLTFGFFCIKMENSRGNCVRSHTVKLVFNRPIVDQTNYECFTSY